MDQKERVEKEVIAMLNREAPILEIWGANGDLEIYHLNYYKEEDLLQAGEVDVGGFYPYEDLFIEYDYTLTLDDNLQLLTELIERKINE